MLLLDAVRVANVHEQCLVSANDQDAFQNFKLNGAQVTVINDPNIGPEITKLPTNDLLVTQRTAWQGAKSVAFVATSPSEFELCQRVVGSTVNKDALGKYDPKFIYVFVADGTADRYRDHHLQVTDVTQVSSHQPEVGVEERDCTALRIETQLEPRNGDHPALPQVSMLRIPRETIKAKISAETFIELTEERRNPAKHTFLRTPVGNVAGYSLGGEWKVGYDEGKGGAAKAECERIGLRIVEDYAKGGILLVEVTEKSDLAAIASLPEAGVGIHDVRPSIKFKAL